MARRAVSVRACLLVLTASSGCGALFGVDFDERPRDAAEAQKDGSTPEPPVDAESEKSDITATFDGGRTADARVSDAGVSAGDAAKGVTGPACGGSPSCLNGGIPCGDQCCDPGFWCDDSNVSGVCRCGEAGTCYDPQLDDTIQCCPSTGAPSPGTCGVRCARSCT